MTGRPKTRERREREARSGKRFDRAARQAILKRAEEIGAAAAAREANVAVGTLRTWRKRLAEEPEPASVGVSESENAPGTRAEKLRARADRARDAQRRADDRADALLARGSAAEARNATVVANGFGDRALQLDEAARAEEAHRIALSEAQGRLVLDLVAAVFDDVALPRPEGLLRARLQGWPEEVDTEVVERARADVRGAIRSEVRAELVAEMEAARLARRALPVGEAEDDGEEVDAEVVEEPAEPVQAAVEIDLEQVRSELRDRFPSQPEAAIAEERRLRVWEGSGGYEGPRRVSQFDQFTHPGLRQ